MARTLGLWPELAPLRRGAARPVERARTGLAPLRARRRPDAAHPRGRRCPRRPAPIGRNGGRVVPRRFRAGEEPGDVAARCARHGRAPLRRGRDLRDLYRRRRSAACAGSGRIHGREVARVRAQARDAARRAPRAASRAPARAVVCAAFAAGRGAPAGDRDRRRSRGHGYSGKPCRTRLERRSRRSPRRARRGGVRQSAGRALCPSLPARDRTERACRGRPPVHHPPHAGTRARARRGFRSVRGAAARARRRRARARQSRLARAGLAGVLARPRRPDRSVCALGNRGAVGGIALPRCGLGASPCALPRARCSSVDPARPRPRGAAAPPIGRRVGSVRGRQRDRARARRGRCRFGCLGSIRRDRASAAAPDPRPADVVRATRASRALRVVPVPTGISRRHWTACTASAPPTSSETPRPT